MNHFRIPVMVLIGLSIMAGTILCGEQEKPFGLNPPGMKPEKFAPGIVSTEFHEFSCTISPDGSEFYFSQSQGDSVPQTLMVTKYENGKLSKAVNLPQSGKYGDFEPMITPDGSKLIFQSWRALPEGVEGLQPDLWYIEKTKNGWSQAKHFGKPFKPRTHMYSSTANNGDLYSAIMMEGKIVKAELKNGKYTDFEILDAPINTESSQQQYPYIAPDESYIIFNSDRQTDKTPSSGIFISYRTKDNKWGEPKMIDTGMEKCAMGIVSPDGKYFFFTNTGDIYWASSKILKK